MDESQQQLEAKGWNIGSVEEFLQLTPEESSYIELKLALSESLRAYRKQRQLTQMDLAKLLKSSQSLVARMEAGDHPCRSTCWFVLCWPWAPVEKRWHR
jgi:predicted XRE-type DNA-binding protein